MYLAGTIPIYAGISQIETLNAFFSSDQKVLKIRSLMLFERDEIDGVARQDISLNSHSLCCELSIKSDLKSSTNTSDHRIKQISDSSDILSPSV
jgi:hypothetical protein